MSMLVIYVACGKIAWGLDVECDEIFNLIFRQSMRAIDILKLVCRLSCWPGPVVFIGFCCGVYP